MQAGLRHENRDRYFVAGLGESGRTTRWLKVKQKGWTVEEDRRQRTISVAATRGAEGEVNDTDARFWHPWLRINRVLRVML